MLAHLGEGESAELIHDAWLRTIEDGVHTVDVQQPNGRSRPVGTAEFADAVIARLGATPEKLQPSCYPRKPISVPPVEFPPGVQKTLVGVDVFVQARIKPEVLAHGLRAAVGKLPELTMITNRGVRVWPDGHPQTLCTDHWRCRFQVRDRKTFTPAMVVELLAKLSAAHIEFVKTEHLYEFDGTPGFSLGQGQ